MLAMLMTWKNVLTRPGEQTFAAERDNFSGTLMYVLKWILLASMTTALLAVVRITLIETWVMGLQEIAYSDSVSTGLILAYHEFRLDLKYWNIVLGMKVQDAYSTFFFHTRLFEFGGGFFVDQFLQIMQHVSHAGQFYAFMRGLLSPSYFLINVAIFHYTSRLLGGQGQFTRYAFLIAAFGAPLTILRTILWYSAYVGARIVAALPDSSQMQGSRVYYGLNHDLNFFVATVLTSYWFFLAFLATKVEHKLTWWRIIIVLVIAFALGYFLRRLPVDLLMGMNGVKRLIRNQPIEDAGFPP